MNPLHFEELRRSIQLMESSEKDTFTSWSLQIASRHAKVVFVLSRRDDSSRGASLGDLRFAPKSLAVQANPQPS